MEDRITELGEQNLKLERANQELVEICLKVSRERDISLDVINKAGVTIKDLWEVIYGLNDKIATLQNGTPVEQLLDLLIEIEPSAEAWYELDSILADHMKVRGVQTTEVKATEIMNRLKLLFPNATFHRMRDDSYFLPTKEKGLEILTRDWSNLITYIAERRDCDKFSTIFKAMLSLFYGLNNAIEVWSEYHSFILLMFSDGELLLEPQTDLTFKVSEVSTALYEVNEVFA